MGRGVFVVVDGLDGVGKGVFLRSLMDAARQEGKRIFNFHNFWRSHDHLPSAQDIIGNFDVVITAEPTFCGVGRYIRTELTANNDRPYSPKSIAHAYALDRQILYEKIVLPLLEAGIDVFQSRSFSTSLVYQRQHAVQEGVPFNAQDILSIPGNAFCYNHPMDFLIIPTIDNVNQVMDRLREREKQDNCQWEDVQFQLSIKDHYESDDFKKIFTDKGVKVIYMDAGKTVEYSQQQAEEFYANYLSNKQKPIQNYSSSSF
jgi:thymidylate kinase